MMDNCKLRLIREEDFEALHTLVSDFEVVKMLGSWPHPADPEFTRSRMTTPEARAGQVLVIEVDGKLAGTIGGVSGGIGYMLGRPYWGRGIVSWAVSQIVQRIFENPDINEVTACVWQDNPASEKVLLKNGFCKTGTCEEFCKVRDVVLKNNRYCLNRADWAGG